MGKSRKKTVPTVRNLYLRKKIAGTRRRAKLVGLLYLIGALALAGIVCLPLMVHDYAMTGIGQALEVMYCVIAGILNKADTIYTDKVGIYDLTEFAGRATLINATLFIVMVLVVFINAIVVLYKLGWLLKNKGTKEHGFNRNVYAMEDMGKAFSTSFAWIIVTYFVVAILCGDFLGTINTLMLIVLGAGLAIHFVGGFFGAKARYYDLENGQVVEQKRPFGRLASVLRNVFQVAAVAGIIVLFDYATVSATLADVLVGNEVENKVLLVTALQLVAALALFVLIKHATATTEYAVEGIYARGMRNFRLFSLIAFVGAAGAVALVAFSGGGLLLEVLFVALVALAAFVVEILMRKHPRLPEKKAEKKLIQAETEFTYEAFNRMALGMEQNTVPRLQKPTEII